MPVPLTHRDRDYLIAARHAADLTQADVAEAAVISLKHLQHIEQGVKQPSEAVLARIADALGLEARVERALKITLCPKRKHRAKR